MKQIRITSGSVEILAELDDTATARALLEVLPCQSSANTWGQEVYFSIPLTVELEADARQVVEPGSVCFWTEGNAIALPYGPTPISQGDECRLVSRVNILGRLIGSPDDLASIKPGDPIRIEAV